IIEAAKMTLDSDAIDMETLISELEKDKIAISNDKEQIEKYKKEIEDLKLSLQTKEEALETKKSEILEKARSEARDIIDEAKEIADKTISDYNKWRSNPEKADMQSMENARSSLRSKLKDYNKNSEAPKQTGGHKPKDFHIGDIVHVLSMGAKGTISELPDQKGNVTVQMGILRSRIHISDLLIVNEPTFTTDATGYKNKKPALGGKNHSTGHTSINKAMTFSPELNVMGMTVDEAIMEIDKFLDDACLTHIEKVTIIHGKGTGALRAGIHQYLKRLKFVKSFRAGEFGEGEHGVTIVEL
ncbi:MAG: Smr/MutS family protein, partial [Lachnospiraceae bacterium]|nr:Smr/MutS family protein [Lachnospiraceae bacterium]